MHIVLKVPRYMFDWDLQKPNWKTKFDGPTTNMTGLMLEAVRTVNNPKEFGGATRPPRRNLTERAEIRMKSDGSLATIKNPRSIPKGNADFRQPDPYEHLTIHGLMEGLTYSQGR